MRRVTVRKQSRFARFTKNVGHNSLKRGEKSQGVGSQHRFLWWYHEKYNTFRGNMLQGLYVNLCSYHLGQILCHLLDSEQSWSHRLGQGEEKMSKCPCQEVSELSQESSHSQRAFGKHINCKEMTVNIILLPEIIEVPQESVGSEKLVPERPGPWDSVCVTILSWSCSVTLK